MLWQGDEGLVWWANAPYALLYKTNLSKAKNKFELLAHVNYNENEGKHTMGEDIYAGSLRASLAGSLACVLALV